MKAKKVPVRRLLRCALELRAAMPRFLAPVLPSQAFLTIANAQRSANSCGPGFACFTAELLHTSDLSLGNNVLPKPP